MKIITTPLDGLLIIEPRVFEDERGYFLETHHYQRFLSAGIDCTFVQDNLSFSKKNILRGLHFQKTKPQAKLVQAVSGEIFDVGVDLRTGSATFGKWSGVVLSEENKRQLFVPEGFAHGFCVLGEGAHIAYKCSDYYDPDDEGGLLWSDPDIAIDWPLEDPILSAKDRQFAHLADQNIVT
jgi:dTDP-4-dehydrorhamnose 3,5-epimerase